jgi:molybdopterin-dependent oxidoreductase alpha subunit
MREIAELYAASERTIACWAMGLTQHAHGVANVQEVMNLLLLRGNVGKPGAGPCPVRGHSNVQGDRTMGIWERPAPAFLDAVEREFGFAPPRAPGFSAIEAIRALHERRSRVFFAMGGNFAAASPDTAYTEEALARAELAVHVATTLNRTHVVAGREALLLPCLSRSERDVQHAGPQFVTVEDSMATVHRSQGTLPPASGALRSEVAIVAGVARSTLREKTNVPWEQLANDYDEIRERIARVVPGCERMNERVREPGGFVLPRPPAERRFPTASGRAELRVVPLPQLELAPGRLLLTTLRSHDQFNTTIYSDDDRYRGIAGDRRVVLANAEDLAEMGLAAGQRVDVTSHWPAEDGEETRRVAGFRLVAYDLPRGCAAAYFPEANPLVPLGHFAERSLTPAYKSIVVTLTPAA